MSGKRMGSTGALSGGEGQVGRIPRQDKTISRGGGSAPGTAVTVPQTGRPKTIHINWLLLLAARVLTARGQQGQALSEGSREGPSGLFLLPVGTGYHLCSLAHRHLSRSLCHHIATSSCVHISVFL